MVVLSYLSSWQLFVTYLLVVQRLYMVVLCYLSPCHPKILTNKLTQIHSFCVCKALLSSYFNLLNCATSSYRQLRILENQKISGKSLKTSQNCCLVLILLPKIKICQYQQKSPEIELQKLNFSRSALFHEKTRVCLNIL